MKKAKILIVVLLLSSLLLSGYGQPGAGREATPQQNSAQSVAATLPVSHYDTLKKSAPALFGAKFEGDAVEGSGEAVDGVYHFAATKTDGEAWHVKLECNYPTTPGNEYHVTYRFHSDVAGKVKFGDFQEFPIVVGDNEVTGLVIAKEGTSYLDLQLGMLPAFNIDFKEIEVVEVQDDLSSEDALPSPIAFDGDDVIIERHDQGYSPDFERTADHVTVSYDSVAWESGVWKARLYVRTGLIPQAGTKYRVAVDVLGGEDMDFEVLLNKDEQEKGYGALYGRHLTAGETQTVETVLNFPQSGYYDGELVLQFSLGNAPEGVPITVSNLHIDKVTDTYTSVLPTGFALDKVIKTGKTLTSYIPTKYTPIALPGLSYNGTETVRERHDNDYEASLEKAADSVTYKITKAPASDRGVWKAQLFVDTGVVLEAGKSYRIALDVKGSADQAKYEACFDGDSENVYGAFYSRSLSAGVTDHVERILTADASHGPLTIRLQFGETNSTAGNNITVSNVRVEEINPTAGDPLATQSYVTGGETLSDELLPLTFAYPTTTGGSTTHVDDAWVNQTLGLSAAAVNNDGSSSNASVVGTNGAKLEITAQRSGGGAWSTRLEVNTGVTPSAGEQYRISATVTAASSFSSNWECKLGNSSTDTGDSGYNQFGGGYGYVGNYTAVPDPDSTIEANHSMELSGDFTIPTGLSEYHPIVLRFDLGNIGLNTFTVSNISVSKFVAAHDEVVDPVTVPNSFVLEPRNGNEVSAATLTGTGSSATAKVTVASPTGTDDWHIKLFANTGVTLTKDHKYQISMKLSSTGDGDYGICYRRDAEGDHDYDYNGNIEFLSGGVVRNTVTAGETGNVQILLKLGKRAADSEITVSDISIKEVTASSGSPAFTANGDVGYDRSLSNTTSSATMKVTAAPESGAEVWKHKLFADTGVTLEPYKFYRVSADVSATNAFDYEICYNRDGEEKGFGAKYGLQAGSTAQTIVYDTQASAAGKLILQFAVGKAPTNTDIVIKNVKVQELSAPAGTNLIPGFACNSVGSFSVAADAGYVTSLEKAASSATLKLESAPASDRNPWNLKFNVKTGFTPEKNKGYRVSFDLTAAKPQGVVEVFYDGNTENAYGQLLNKTLVAGTQNISYTMYHEQSFGELSLQIRLGRTNDNGSNSYTVSNVKIEEVTFEVSSKPESKDAAELFTHTGYTADLKKTATNANITFKSVPAFDSREPWMTKLFIDTGVTLKQGVKYRVSFEVFSNADTPFEVCFNKDNVEKGVGAMYGLNATMEPQIVEYVAYANEDAHLVIQFSLGKASAPSTFNVNNIKVERAGATSEVSDTIYTF